MKQTKENDLGSVWKRKRSAIMRRRQYLQRDEHSADMDGEVKDSDDHADNQVRLQTLVLGPRGNKTNNE